VEKKAPETSDYARSFNVFVDDAYFEVVVDEPDGPPMVVRQAAAPQQSQSAPQPAARPQPAPAPQPQAKPAAPQAPPKKEPAQPKTAEKPAPAPSADGTAVKAPMPGMIINYVKQVGDSVEEGETVVILEAMKMENSLPAPVAGTIKAINFSVGDSVAKNDVLCTIG
jgi:oxaloacetate decarboxylase alpha subunit/pyruvate carboxylase subunit B